MSNLISRQALCEYALNQKDKSVTPNDIMRFPSAQPELPKQFMSDDCISRSELYKKVCEAEKLARERVMDTPSDSPFPNKLNPAYTRYSAQLDERTQFKHMIADARSVQPEIIHCRDCRYYQDNNDGYPHIDCKWDSNETPDADDFCSGAERW